MEKADMKIKKGDVLLILVLLLLALAGYVGLRLFRRANTVSPVAVVLVDGREYGRYPLSEDIEETIRLENGAYNTFVIKEGSADMTDASCPDQICINHRKISRRGESIVCLPDKVVIQIENGEAAEVDGFTH